MSAITAAGTLASVVSAAGGLLPVGAGRPFFAVAAGISRAVLAVITDAVFILIKIGTVFSTQMSFLADRVLSAGLAAMSQGRDCKSQCQCTGKYTDG